MDLILLNRDSSPKRTIEAWSVIRDQEDGGQDVLTFSTSDVQIYKGMRILAQMPTLDWQEYVITELTLSDRGMDATCEHAIYDMFGEFIEDLRPTGTPDYLLDVALQNSRWKRFGSSAGGSYSTNFYRISVREAVAKVQELTGLILRYRVNVAGSEIVNRWCWWEEPGANNLGYRFEDGYNAENIEQHTDDTQIITSLYGFGRGEYNPETGGYGRRVDFSALNNGLKYVEDAGTVALYGRQIFGKIEFDDTEDPAEVLARTQAELARRTRPNVNYSGTVYDLGFDNTVTIGETVLIRSDRYPAIMVEPGGYRLMGRVLRLVSYLDQTQPNRITIGNYNNVFAPVKDRRTLAQIREQMATDPTRGGLEAVNSKIVSELLDNFNRQINDGMLTGTVTALPGGFIFESEDGVTHIGPQGWRVANTKTAGGDWIWRTLATADGLAAGVVGAEQIIAGAITTDSISIGGGTLTKKLEDVEDGAREYADAQDALRKTEAEAYADGIVTAEESARITQATANLNAAKSHADTKAAAAEQAAKNYSDGKLSNFAVSVTADLDDLQDQIDGSITTWFYPVPPTNTNAPANTWTTTDLKNIHLGDLYYDTETGYSYRWQVKSNAYSWQRLTDSDITKALSDAAKAQDTADGKRRVFGETPAPPYDVNDLWVQGTSGEIMRCVTPRGVGGSYVASDWAKASKYTDDTRALSAESYAESLTNDLRLETDAAQLVLQNAQTALAQAIEAAQADGVVTQDELNNLSDLVSAQETAQTNLKDAQGALKDNLDATKAGLDQMRVHIRTDGEGRLVFGKDGDKVTLVQSNNRLSFLSNGTEVAYFSDNKLYVNEADINKMKIGGFVKEEQTDGGTITRWVGLA